MILNEIQWKFIHRGDWTIRMRAIWYDDFYCWNTLIFHKLKPKTRKKIVYLFSNSFYFMTFPRWFIAIAIATAWICCYGFYFLIRFMNIDTQMPPHILLYRQATVAALWWYFGIKVNINCICFDSNRLKWIEEEKYIICITTSIRMVLLSNFCRSCGQVDSLNTAEDLFCELHKEIAVNVSLILLGFFLVATVSLSLNV